MTVEADFERLEQRVGRLHLRQRMGIQADHVTDVFGQGVNFFHIENVYWLHYLIKLGLKCLGLYRRGQRNALDMRITHNDIVLDDLPSAFEGYTILHLTDLHADFSVAGQDALIEKLKEVDYDLCILTGDYRMHTSGSYDGAMEGVARIREHIKGPAYGILGNHDFIEMLADFEEMDLPILLNESVRISRDNESMYLVGIDDPHFYQADNMEQAMSEVPHDAFTILLSHSPEIYRKAAYCGIDLMFCGHTHGGQLCLPGGLAVLLNARCPRGMCVGAWKHGTLSGYTSVGTGSSGLDVRYNCPPEIALHHLKRA